MRLPSRQTAQPSRPDLRLVSASAGRAPLTMTRRALWFCIASALLLGTVVRAGWAFSADFPLNDGGMFYAMTLDLQAAGYRIPDSTTYNLDAIPFAYPPLGLYAAAAVSDVTGMQLLDTFRLLPLALSLALMGAFVLLARRLLDDRIALAGAVFAFVMIPRSYEWFIMGGGITRGFGFLFAMLALHEAHRMYTGRSAWAALTTGALAGLAALSHIEMTWFFAFSCALIMLFFGRNRRGAARTAMAALVAFAVSSPWWIAMLVTHGPSPFIASATTGSPSEVNPLLVFLVFRPTDEALFPIIAATALVGVVWSLGQRQWFLPLWVLACGLLDPRGFGNVATIPLALLAGVAVAHVLLPASLGYREPGTALRRWAVPASIIAFLGLYAMINAMVATPRLLDSVDPDQRAAMAWAASNTTADSEFLVVTGESWAVDRASEWFPVLAGRRSVATVQGYEWIEGAFGRQLDASRDVQRCAMRDVECLRGWESEYEIGHDYVMVSRIPEMQRANTPDAPECCAALRQSLQSDPRYRAVFESAGATIFERLR